MPDQLQDLAPVQTGDTVLGRAVALVRCLRTHCPWDAKQTPESLRPYLLEEAHECAEAIANGDDPGLATELGDLLLNVAFQIVLGEERGAFDAETVVGSLEAKMVRRHPHVFGTAESPPDWEAMKAAERREQAGGGGGSQDEPERPRALDPFEGMATGLDPLSRSARLQDRMAALGFDWPDLAGPLAKVAEEASELTEAAELDGAVTHSGRVDAEAGDLLFASINAIRIAGAHPANALIRANTRFESRCRKMLLLAAGRGIDPAGASLDQLDELWEEVKAGERLQSDET